MMEFNLFVGLLALFVFLMCVVQADDPGSPLQLFNALLTLTNLTSDGMVAEEI